MNSKSLTFIFALLAPATLPAQNLAATASAQTVAGTAKDGSGAPVVGGVSVAISQIAQPTGSQRGQVQVAPGFNATATVDSTGSFVISNVPAGQYWVCAYPSSPGYLSSCDWNAPANRPINVPAPTQAPLSLTLAKGTIVTLDVNDPGGKIATEALNSGHWFYPGMLDALGDYSAAKPSSTTGTHHYYVVTIPTSGNVKLFVDSDLNVLDASGNPVATRAPSSISISGANGSLNLALSVQ